MACKCGRAHSVLSVLVLIALAIAAVSSSTGKQSRILYSLRNHHPHPPPPKVSSTKYPIILPLLDSHPHPHPPPPPLSPKVSSTKYPRILPPLDPLAMNASGALREAGYHIMATAFELFAAEFIPLGPVTFFAISDQALLKSRLPPWVMMKLLRYHTITEMLLRDDLHILTSGICIRTVLSHKGLIVTHEQTENSTVAFNGVPITDENIFAAVGLAIHGVHQPFYYPGRSLHSLPFFPTCIFSESARGVSVQRHHRGA